MKNEILELIEISKLIGNMPDLIQGGGGNTSVKLDDDIMAIKASGIFLKNMAANHGISFVNYKAIRSFIDSTTPESVTTMDAFIRQQTVSYENIPLQRPSIETGFHAILDKYTIHSHSVYANILTCAENAEVLIKKLFPKSHWITYCTPGAPLTMDIEKARLKSPQPIYFIQNHGAITTAQTKKEALERHFNIQQIIQQNFSVQSYEDFEADYENLDFMRTHILFPDQVVYTINDEVIHTEAAQETIKSYFYILQMHKNNKLTPRFLPQSEVETIHNLESEKYRKGLLKP